MLTGTQNRYQGVNMAVTNPHNLYEAEATSEKTLRSGALALLDDKGRVFKILTGEDADFYWEAKAEAGLVYCSICDGVGHGQPGYGPCPLEEPFGANYCQCNGRQALDGSGCLCGGS
jgi:hypothetical protein